MYTSFTYDICSLLIFPPFKTILAPLWRWRTADPDCLFLQSHVCANRILFFTWPLGITLSAWYWQEMLFSHGYRNSSAIHVFPKVFEHFWGQQGHFFVVLQKREQGMYIYHIQYPIDATVMVTIIEVRFLVFAEQPTWSSPVVVSLCQGFCVIGYLD